MRRAKPKWKQVDRFRDVKVGDYVQLVRPEAVVVSDDLGGAIFVRRAVYEGYVEYVNPRGEMRLEGHLLNFLEDAMFGAWFYEIRRAV